MTNTLAALTRHPLHASVLESFADLRQAPSEQQASFTATISRILSEAFVKKDADFQMPGFLIDPGVTIARFEIQDLETQIAPGASEVIGSLIGRWHDTNAEAPGQQAIVTSNRFALCGAFPTLASMIDHPVLRAGGVLAFFDPIYEDSLILIRLKASSYAEWYLRQQGKRVAA